METKNESKTNLDYALYSKQKGDSVYYRKRNRYRSSVEDIIRNLTVSSMTSKYLYAKDRLGTLYKFDINTGMEITRQHNANGKVYSSEKHYKALMMIQERKANVVSKLYDTYDYALICKIEKMLDEYTPMNKLIEETCIENPESKENSGNSGNSNSGNSNTENISLEDSIASAVSDSAILF